MKYNTVEAFCITAVFLASVHLVRSGDEEYVKAISEAEKTCVNELGITKPVQEYSSQDLPREIKCLLKCTWEKMGRIKSDGTFDLELIKIDMDKKEYPADVIDAVKKKSEECAVEIKPDPEDLCESAYQFMICLKRPRRV